MTEKMQFARSFASSANRFIAAVNDPKPRLEDFAPELLGALTDLYRSALALPDTLADNLDVSPDIIFSRVNDDEWQRVYDGVGTVMGDLNFYWLQYNPIHPRDGSEKPVCGALGDDCADIYRDIVSPLRVFDSGRFDSIDDIIWEWCDDPFKTHWGLHAVRAMTALHWIVFQNTELD
jgi:hypothetical protein